MKAIMIGSVLLIVLTIVGWYIYYAMPMQEVFTQLQRTQSTDCHNSNTWQIVRSLDQYPPRLPLIFTGRESSVFSSTLARITVAHFPQIEKRSLWRNLQELVAVLEIERHFSESQRITLIINHSHMGNNGDCEIKGITAASHFYFGHDPETLSVAEMVLLLGISRSPNYYNPFKHPDRTIKLRNTILERLFNNKLLTDMEYQTALSEALPIHASPE